MKPSQIKRAYEDGENITGLLRGLEGSSANTEEIIEIAYDLQSGSYTEGLRDDALRRHKEQYGSAIAEEICRVGMPGSVLEVGVGEATTFSFVLRALEQPPLDAHGIDISWSRIFRAQQWLKQEGIPDVFLSLGSLFQLPYADNSFDVVYTSHSIEPNGGKETGILRELYRVASRVLVLLEPGFELSDEAARKRMESLGYCQGLSDKSKELGFNVVKHELFPHSASDRNPTAITVIEKEISAENAVPRFACPRYGSPMSLVGGAYYSPENSQVYPLVGGIPCLRPSDGFIAGDYGLWAAESSQ